jgi:hypothetical protein
VRTGGVVFRLGVVAGGYLLAAALSSCGSQTLTSGGGDAPGTWTNEPAGFGAIADQPWNAIVDAEWRRRSSAHDRIAEEPSAPRSPRAVLEYTYPAGFAGGTAPATHYFPLQHAKEIYIGLVWRSNERWHGHQSGVNKIQFVYLAGGGDVAMVMYGSDGGPYELRVLPQWPEHTRSWLTSNVARRPVRPGTWHRIEWHLRYESRPGAGDGTIRWWLDGALLGSYSDLRFPGDAGFAEYQISPTWGGVGDTKRQTDTYQFDHTYLSAPRAGPAH